MNNKGFQTQRKILHKVFNAGRPSFPRNLGMLDNTKEGGGGGGRGGGGGGEVGEEVEREVDGLGLNNGLHPTNRA